MIAWDWNGLENRARPLSQGQVFGANSEPH